MTKHHGPVDRTINMLKAAGYRQCEVPLSFAGMQFEFVAVLAGSPRALDLIVIIDTLSEPELRIRQKVEGLSRALDLVKSRRPLTTIIVGPPLRSSVAEALSRVSRVLQVGTPTGEHADNRLRDAVAALLPPDVRDINEALADPLGELRQRLNDVGHLGLLLDASLYGSQSVSQTLGKWLSAALHPSVDAGIL